LTDIEGKVYWSVVPAVRTKRTVPFIGGGVGERRQCPRAVAGAAFSLRRKLVRRRHVFGERAKVSIGTGWELCSPGMIVRYLGALGFGPLLYCSLAARGRRRVVR